MGYRCDSPNLMLGATCCLTFGSSRVDSVLARELLRAVEPIAVEAAIAAERLRMERVNERRHILELDLQQARYEALLAERRYAACDPDNRLIAAQLEKCWETALRQVEACQARLEPATRDMTQSATPPISSGWPDDPNGGFAQANPPHQLLEAAARQGGRAAQAKVRVNHVDVGLMPAKFASALAEGVLKPQAFLIAHHLMGRRLTDIDDRLAIQVDRLDQFGLHGRSPPELRRRRRRSDAVGLATAPPTDLLDPCSWHSRHSAAKINSRSASTLNLV